MGLRFTNCSARTNTPGNGDYRGNSMPETGLVAVKKLVLDVRNYRTVAQPSEHAAIHALIALDPEYFWGLMESLIDDGYLPTENIIVLRQGKQLVVKEGNRRIAALKIIHGLVSADDFDLPDEISESIAALSSAWKKTNASVPCNTYDAGDKEIVDRIVSLTHGKGEKAGRRLWNAVARARHSRDEGGIPQPPLDLLEAFLKSAKKITPEQAERWAGKYNLTVLEEALKRLAVRLGYKSAPELAKAYPKIKNKASFDELLVDIGLEQTGFKEVRAEGFGTKYGMPPPTPQQPAPGATGGAPNGPPAGSTGPGGSSGPTGAPPSSGGGGTSGPTGPAGNPNAPGGTGAAPPTAKPPVAHPAGDPKAVAAILKKFKPKGSGREKVATLLKELKSLDIEATPHAFCFVLRSMFEISAKAYCDDHAAAGLIATEASGGDKKLAKLLKEIVNHLTANNQDTAKVKLLQGASTELANPTSILSITSLNQLVHSPHYVVSGSNVCLTFKNVFPLLAATNG